MRRAPSASRAGHGAAEAFAAQDNRALFEDAPIPVLREDWSGVKAELDALRRQGVTDIDAYLEHDPDFVVAVRGKHRFIDANRQAVALFDVADKAAFLAQASKFLPAQVSSNTEVLRALFNGAEQAKGERTFRTRTGELRTVLWRTQIPTTVEGLKRMHFYALDITEQKRAQAAILEAQAELAHAGRVQVVGELATSLAHEVKQPLGAIATFASAASRWLTHPEPQLDQALEDLEKISINSRRAAGIIGHIQGFIRKTPIAMTPHPPEALAMDALALVNWQAHRSNILTRTEIAPNLPDVRVDGVQIQQVLVNLMINAVQAMSEAPAERHELLVQVLAPNAQGQIVFRICDTGPGVPENEIERIFEPFVSTREGGMGMGLAIARTILRGHESQLGLTNLEPHGARFSFALKAVSNHRP